MTKEDKVKKQEQKAIRESEVFHAISTIQEFKKANFNGDYSESIFWAAVHRIEADKRTEKQAKKEIEAAEEKLNSLKRKYKK
jgi:hypothetical protein